MCNSLPGKELKQYYMVIQKTKLLVEEANVLLRRRGSLLFCIFKLDTAGVQQSSPIYIRKVGL